MVDKESQRDAERQSQRQLLASSLERFLYTVYSQAWFGFRFMVFKPLTVGYSDLCDGISPKFISFKLYILCMFNIKYKCNISP